MSHGSPHFGHKTPASHHFGDIWEVAKVALRECLIIAIIATASVGLNAFLMWIGKITHDGKEADVLFAYFVSAVKVLAYLAFGAIMLFSLMTDVLKAWRRFCEEWRSRHPVS